MRTNWQSLRSGNSRRRQQANLDSLQPASEPATKSAHWLADAEEVLVSLLSLGTRAIGSLTLGLAAFYDRAPANRLQTLERHRAVLPWATLLVGMSALFSALYPLAIEFGNRTLREWAASVAQTANIASYAERFIPVLGIGLLLCAVAHLRHLNGRRNGEIEKTRLLVSTFFALSLASGFLLSIPFHTSMLPSELDSLAYGALGSAGIYVSRASPFVGMLVPISVSFALARWSVKKARRCRIRALRLVSQAALGVLALPLGFGLVLAVPYACYAAISTASPWFATFKVSSDPAETAEFYPNAASCYWVQRGLSCTFSARTSGNGDVLLDMRYPILISSREKLGSLAAGEKRLSRENSAPANPVYWGIFTRNTMEGIEWSFPTISGLEDSPFTRLELGKTFVVQVLFVQEHGCKAGPPESLNRLLREDFRNVYLEVVEAREDAGTAEELASIIGPWHIPPPGSYGQCR